MKTSTSTPTLSTRNWQKTRKHPTVLDPIGLPTRVHGFFVEDAQHEPQLSRLDELFVGSCAAMHELMGEDAKAPDVRCEVKTKNELELMHHLRGHVFRRATRELARNVRG